MTENNETAASSESSTPGSAFVFTPTAGFSVRNYLSNQHLWSAQHYARLCRSRENELVDSGENNIDIQHRSYAMSAVMSAVAFLEAYINEAFQDAVDQPTAGSRVAGIDIHAVRIMSEMWTAENQRIKRSLSILDKYQLALLAANAPKIDPGLTVYQSAKDVIDIRNALVHFSPETQFDHSQIALEKRLRGKNKFTENQQDVGSPWYPNKALGAGLAAWACESVTAVVAQWQGRLHTEYDYAQWIALNP